MSEETKKEEKVTEHINLKVVGQDGQTVHFKIKKHTQLKKLIHAFCEKSKLVASTVRFRFDGQPITENDTPQGLEMEDGDTIEVFQQQTGGCVLSWYEPVIVRKGDSLNYKQLIVTGEEVLMVDTPPKAILPLIAINNIAAVLLVHDLPQFLEGGLRDRTTHILLKIRDNQPKVVPSFSTKSIASRRLSLRDQYVIDEEDRENGNVFMPNNEKKSVRQEVSNPVAKPETKIKPFSRRSLFTRTSSLDLLSFTSKQKEKVDILPSKHRPPLRRGFAREGEKNIEDEISLLALSRNRHSIGEIAVGSHVSRSPTSSFPCRQVERPLSPALTELISRVDGNDIRLNTRSSTPDISLSSHQMMPRSVSALENYHESPHFMVQNTLMRCRSVLDKPSGVYSLPITKKTNGLLSHGSSDAQPIDCEEELHIYSLSTSTHLYHLLHSLWMSSLLAPEKPLSLVPSSTNLLNLDEEEFKKTFIDVNRNLKKSSSVKESFEPLQDLKQGVKSYSSVRRLFWKDKDCLDSIRLILREFIPSRASNEFEDDEGGSREDELALLILANEVLENALSRSQGCPHKAKAFNSKSMVESLLQEVFAPPKIPSDIKLTCDRFLLDFRELSTMTWELLPEREIISLTQKLIDSSVRVAFHTIEAIFEIGWNASCKRRKHSIEHDIDSISLHTLMQHVPTEQWLSYAIPQLFFLIHVKPRDYEESLTASEVVLIYQYFGVFLALIKQSPRSLAFCIQNFSEELRYYVCESTLKKLIEPLSPLRSHTLRMAQSISKLFYKEARNNRRRDASSLQ